MSMIKRYFFGLDENGRAVVGTVVEYPEEYETEGTEEVFLNQERAFYIDGEWVIYDRLTIAKSSDEPIKVDEEITVTATLPADSPDSAVTFSVAFNGVPLAEPVAVAVTDGQAVQSFIFDTPGYYAITAASTHHGAASVGVNITEASAG